MFIRSIVNFFKLLDHKWQNDNCHQKYCDKFRYKVNVCSEIEVQPGKLK